MPTVNKSARMSFDFWTVATFVSGAAVLAYVGWLVFNARQMRSPAYQKRFAKLSEADLARLVERMQIPLERGSDEFDVSKSQVSATGWRLEGVRGQQVWKHYADERLAPWPQTVWEKYHVGVPLSDAEAPRSAGKAGDSLTAALNGARFAAKLQVTSTGHWANDYGGPMFLLPGMVIVRHIVNAPFERAQRLEIVRYLRGKQNGDGGWGLHIDSPSCIFGSVLSYVSLRILGVPAGDGACARGREFMNKNGGVLGAPDWAKFWLSTLGVYDYRGLRPLTPELWIMPRWVPFHPWRYWCHARMVYLPMSYCYGVRFVAAHTPLVDELRRELYGMYAGGYDAVDWPAHQFHTCPLDYFQPLSWLAKFAFSALWVYERLPALPGALLRARALKWIVELIDVEDESTNYIDIGPVNKCMNMVAIFHRYGADSPQLRKHLARTADYLWQAADGMKMQGYNGSQLWDTSFVCQAMSSLVRALPAPLPDADPIMLALRRGYGFFDIAQVRRDLELRDYYYRHPSNGAWPFSTEAHGWPISDCTSEGLKGVLACERLGAPGSAAAEQLLSNRRLCDAIDILLTYQNADDGGFPTYELKRAGEWLELLNPAEVFARIMVDYSYVELTSACITAMVQFRKRNAECAAYRRADIDDSLRRALEFVKMRQRADGSWYGSWAVCFTYGGWFGIEALTHMGQGDSDEAARAVEFFISKQNADGGWGESWWSCLLGEYCTAASMPECTGWCLLSYAHAVDAGVCNARPELAKRLRASADRAAQCLIQLQLPNGDWKPGPTCGMFNGSVTISYNIYSKAFPIWALAEHARVFGTMK
jgi:lanosterol synthase